MHAPRDPHRPTTAAEEPREPAVARLGPPGWREFTEARRRFETTLVVQGLEHALRADPAGPADGTART